MTEPKCTCGAQVGIPHDEACPVTAYVRAAFRDSGENAQGRTVDYVSPTGRLPSRDGMAETYERLRDYAKGKPVVIVGAGMASETARMVREALSTEGFAMHMIEVDSMPRGLFAPDFAELEQRVSNMRILKSRDTDRAHTFKLLYGAPRPIPPIYIDWETERRTAQTQLRGARKIRNKRKAQRRARTGRK